MFSDGKKVFTKIYSLKIKIYWSWIQSQNKFSTTAGSGCLYCTNVIVLNTQKPVSSIASFWHRGASLLTMKLCCPSQIHFNFGVFVLGQVFFVTDCFGFFYSNSGRLISPPSSWKLSNKKPLYLRRHHSDLLFGSVRGPLCVREFHLIWYMQIHVNFKVLNLVLRNK